MIWIGKFEGSGKEKKTGMERNGSMATEDVSKRCQSRRDRKFALQQDVDKLRKKLRNEENIHRALERAFTRPLGALPRLPPYLPSHTLELLAEVAVLEEEVVRLEEQVVNFWQGLYQEAIFISSCKKTKELGSDARFLSQCSKTLEQPKSYSDSAYSEDSAFIKQPTSVQRSSNMDQTITSSTRFTDGKLAPKKPHSSLAVTDKQQGKENLISGNVGRNCKKSPAKKVPKVSAAAKRNTQADSWPKCTSVYDEGAEIKLSSSLKEAAFEMANTASESTLHEPNGPNKLSEDILKCLMDVFSRMSSPGNTKEHMETSPSVSGSSGSLEESDSIDPYGICAEFGRRDIGPYKLFQAVETSLNVRDLLMGCSFLTSRLKRLLGELASVDLAGLTHQQKIAFWINIYNSCMMNAFLEQGIPANPEMIIALMLKAMINVGGHLLNAMTIEHFILRLPYRSTQVSPKGSKSDYVTMRGIFGLEWPEPLVTFALSCGSWSSPAVRVYTADQVENELERAKRDYLQAAIGISTPNRLAIPKLLDWYLRDFAKDVDSLMDWICLQLPDELRTEAIKCLEMAKRSPIQQLIQLLPYEFRFRYLLAP
uniref:Ternary complex factor MIP1 leucine-zipper domain-containing protein n=1 Tax=Musa acuminata subsp. malaccensis TaxID=214687 RepID=A0A804KA51_MUSAM|nr:PREDICTED: uncharacterized protein LOC103995220 isoform X3 [Musa acuminata subsp. malaccensis]